MNCQHLLSKNQTHYHSNLRNAPIFGRLCYLCYCKEKYAINYGDFEDDIPGLANWYKSNLTYVTSLS